jgi:hypothetical protein
MSDNVIIKSERRLELEARVRALVDALPQRQAILEGDARNWIEQVVAEHGELAIWHAIRAGGFGGSQIGTLVRNYLGQRADHEASAHDIVAGTLLRKVPEEPTGHMSRGIAMESEHRKWFYRKYGAQRNERDFSILSKGVGPRPWMRYSPDELALMADPRGTSSTVQNWLGDYKAPSQVDHASNVAFQYVCQLHMGRMVCVHNGVHIDGMVLSQFDWQNWALKDDVIEHNPDLEPLITAAGDQYWECVLRGEVPPYVYKSRLDDAKSLVEEINDDAFRLSRLKSLGKELIDAAEEIQVSMIEKASKYRFGASKLNVEGNLSISATSVFDEDLVRPHLTPEIVAGLPLKKASSSAFDQDKLLKRVRETLQPGEKISSFYAPGKFETEPLYQALLDAGVDVDSLMKESLRVTIAPAVKKDAESYVQREFAELLPKKKQEEATDDGVEIGRGVEGDVRHAPRSLVA